MLSSKLKLGYYEMFGKNNFVQLLINYLVTRFILQFSFSTEFIITTIVFFFSISYQNFIITYNLFSLFFSDFRFFCTLTYCVIIMFI